MDAKVQNYLKERFGPETSLLGIQRLGEDIHGVASLLRFRTVHGEIRLIMKTLFPSEFGHDHFSDRAQVLLLANANYNEMQNHVKAIDVIGETTDRLISLKEVRELYLFMDETKGDPYFKDLNEILERGGLTEVDRDYHPGNIWRQGDDFTLLDRSRGTWGEPACDLSCLGVNYIYYAIKDRGTFDDPFSELFRVFLKSYLEETNDYGFFEVTQPFFAFRVLVLANPKFYPGDTAEIKRKLLDFGHSVLETERFDTERISEYMERK